MVLFVWQSCHADQMMAFYYFLSELRITVFTSGRSSVQFSSDLGDLIKPILVTLDLRRQGAETHRSVLLGSRDGRLAPLLARVGHSIASDLPSCLWEGEPKALLRNCALLQHPRRGESASQVRTPNPHARGAWAESLGDPWAVSLLLASSLHHRAHGPWAASSSSHGALLYYRNSHRLILSLSAWRSRSRSHVCHAGHHHSECPLAQEGVSEPDGLRPCLDTPKTQNFTRFLITSNLAAHVWSIKYR